MKDQNDNKTLELIDDCDFDLFNERIEIDERSAMYIILDIIVSIENNKLSKADLKLFKMIILHYANLNVRSVFEINQSELAKNHYLKQSNVSRSLNKLIKERLIIKVDKKTYKLNISKSI